MVETSWFETVDNNIIDKPGKYTLKGDYAQALLDKYYSYLDLAKDNPEEFKDLEAAAKRAIASFRASMEKPSTATKEKAPSRSKKDKEREIRARVFEARIETEFFSSQYGPEFDTLSEAQFIEKAKEQYREDAKRTAELYAKLPENEKDSPAGRRYKKILAITEDDFVQRNLAALFEYKAANNELAEFLKEPLPYPDAVEPEIDSDSLESTKPDQPRVDGSKQAPDELNALANLGIDFQPATMDASGTRLPTPGAFTGKFQEILEGADSWSEVADRLQGQTITYFDFETTGISDYDGQDVFNDPVQLGAVQVKDGKIVKRFNMYVNPESRLSDWSANNLKRDVLDENGDIVLDENGKPTTTLVTPEWLAQQPSQKEALDAFIEFIGPDALLGGQNVPFDVEILKRMADKYDTPLSIAGTIDSKDLASLLPKYDPEKGVDGPKAPDRKTGEIKASSSLGPVANFLGFEPANWHSADGDAEDSYNLVSKLISRAAEENNSNLSLLDFDAMQERYNERMAEFKQVVSGDNPITEAQEKALSSMAESANPEIAELAREALANKSTRGAAAEALSRLHALENAAQPQPDASKSDAASSSSGRKYNLDNISWSTTKQEPEASDTTADASWKEIQDIKPAMFDSIYYAPTNYLPGRADSDANMFHGKLADVYRARKNFLATKDDDSKKQYIDALTSLFEHHRSSAVSKKILYVAPNYRPDGILDAVDVAKLMQPFRQFENSQDRSSLSQETLDQVIAKYKSRIERQLPEPDERYIASLRGNWKVAAKALYTATIKRFSDAEVDSYFDPNSVMYGYSKPFRTIFTSEEDKEALKKYFLLRVLRSKAESDFVKSAYREVIDDRGNVIRIYRNPRSSDVKNTTASNGNIRTAIEAFDAIRDRMGSDKLPLTISFTAPSNVTPSGLDSSRPDELGWALPTAGGHVIVSRHTGQSWRYAEYDPATSHHSAAFKNDDEYIQHTIIHELGHVLMYKYWGKDTVFEKGDKELEADYRRLGIDISSGETRVSRYGAGSIVEHFAEAYARYIITGDASPKFIELLRSKGLLKSQEQD